MDEKINIVLVDDQPGKLLTYEAMLDDLGENLIKAHSGIEALEHLLKTDIALVLMDVSMPGMDGFETAEDDPRASTLSKHTDRFHLRHSHDGPRPLEGLPARSGGLPFRSCSSRVAAGKGEGICGSASQDPGFAGSNIFAAFLLYELRKVKKQRQPAIHNQARVAVGFQPFQIAFYLRRQPASTNPVDG